MDYLFRLIYLFEGELVTTASFDGVITVKTIAAGEIFVGNKGHWAYINLPASNCKALSIIFTQYHIRLLYSEFSGGEVLQQPYCHLQYDSPLLEKFADTVDSLLLDSLARPGFERQSALRLLLKSTTWELLHEITQLSKPESAHYPEILRKILFYIQVNFSANISCNSICSDLKVNRTYASSLFHQHIGMEMKSYLQKLRLDKSLQLLSYPITVSQIAQQCGFSSSKYFIACFRRIHGLSPGKYRDQHLS